MAKATGDDFEDWKKFIVKHDLTFLNVGLTKTVFEKAMEELQMFFSFKIKKVGRKTIISEANCTND